MCVTAFCVRCTSKHYTELNMEAALLAYAQAVDDIRVSPTTRRWVRKMPTPIAAVQPPSTSMVAHERDDILSASRFEERHSPVLRPSRYQCHFYEHTPSKHRSPVVSPATSSFSSSGFTASCMQPTASWQRRSSSPRQASRSGASPQWPRDALCHSQATGGHWVW